jgi:hypothetical protein
VADDHYLPGSCGFQGTVGAKFDKWCFTYQIEDRGHEAVYLLAQPLAATGENIQSQCVIVDIQIIGRKLHASTGLDGRIDFKNKAIRERPGLPHHSSLQSI